MESRHEPGEVLREEQPFHGTILDIGMADKTQVELFTAIGSTRGPFKGVIDWPYLNGLMEDRSKKLLASEGEEVWRTAGGIYGEDGKPTFTPTSSHAAQVVQGIADGGGGFIWTDANGVGWAVRLVPLAGRHAYAGLAISWSGGGRVIDPVARDEYRRAVEEKMAELDLESEAATGHKLQQLADRMWLYKHAEQLLYAIHQAVLIQRSSIILLPDVALGQVIWGGDRKAWPANWRNSLMDILSSLSELHVAALRIGGMSWRPKFTMRSVAVAHCELVERTAGIRDVCCQGCPLWNRPDSHEHFRIQIGYGFLGLLERFTIADDRAGRRQFDFEQKKPQGEAGKALAQARRNGQLVPVHLPTRVFGRLSPGETGIFQALVREVIRGRHRTKSNRPDKAELLIGNQVPDVRGRTQVACPLLQPNGRYVSFNGNGRRRGLGYLIVGKGASGWLARCGHVPGVEDKPKWGGKDGIGKAVRAFLADLAEVRRLLGLTVVGLARLTGEWLDLKRLTGIAELPNPLNSLRDVHLRVYGPEDYLDRCRRLVAQRGCFSDIPGGVTAATAPESGPLLGDPNLDLKVRLHRAGLTQQNLARHLGVSAAFVSDVLNGKKHWPQGMRDRAEALIAGDLERADEA
jgi:hypothetical protein